MCFCISFFYNDFLRWGGGGAASASLPAEEYTTHNRGGWGGGGSSSGGSSGGSSGSGTNVTLQGFTPLVVTGYTFNGTTYPDVTALTLAMNAAGATAPSVTFTVAGETTPRTARVTKTDQGYSVEHQYRATCVTPDAASPAIVYYYANDGVNLSSYTPSGFGWQCQQDGSVHMGSNVTGVTGDITLTMVNASGLPFAKMYIRTDFDTSSATSYEIDESRTVAHSADPSNLGSIIVTPLPQSAMYTETQSGSAVTWNSYNVTVTIDGTNHPVSFSSTATQAVKITGVPEGATVSATAQIGVPSAVNYPGNTLNAATTGSVTLQSGSSELKMYAQYPLSFAVQTAHNGSVAAASGASYYTNQTPTALPTASATYTSASNETMYFTGWSTQASGAADFTGDSIPANGTYKGKLTLYSCYGSCAVSISGTGVSAGTTPVLLSGETLSLTATPSGFPNGAMSYAWSVSSGTSVTVSGSGANATVTPVANTTGTATVKVVATCAGSAMTAEKTLDVIVAALSITGDTVIKLGDTGKTLAANVSGYAGTVEYQWTNGTTTVLTVDSPNSSTTAITPLQGGLATITLAVTLKDGSGNTIKILPAKTLNVAVLQLQLGGSGLPANDGDPIVLTAGSTETATLTATLVGLTADSWLWQSSESAKFTVSNPSNIPTTTITPVAAGSGTVTVKATYHGVDITSSLDVSVVGLNITGSATHIWDDSAPSHTMSLSVAAVGLPEGASVTYHVGQYDSSNTDVANIEISGTGTSITVIANKGGVTTVTAKATYCGKNLTATKEIAILRLLVTDGDGNAVPATGNGLVLAGTKALTAVLEGIPAADVEYEWTSSAGTKISLSPADEATTTLTGVALGNSNISVTATYKGTTSCNSPAMAFKVALGSKATPDAVGDIVFTDGTAEPYVDGMTLTDEQKAAAIAVIFYKGTDLNNGDDTTTVRTLGKGLINASSLYFVNPPSSGWASIGYIKCNATYDSFAGSYSVTGGYKNGSNALEEISRWFDDNSISNDTGNSSKYPALYWAKNYKEKLMTGETTSRLIGTDFEDGWYLPTFAEMCKFQVSTAVATKIKNAIELCGGDYFVIGNSTQYYWTACQNSSGSGYMPFRFNSLTSNSSLGGVYSGSAGDSIGACAIREF